MSARAMLRLSLLCLLVVGSSHGASVAQAQRKGSPPWERKGRETGLPVPRFVSLKADNARMRIGPDFEYAIQWLYRAPGLPLEIIGEYGNWRQVRDCDGISGWMHRSLLSGVRTAVVGPWRNSMASLSEQPRKGGREKAKLEPRVRVQILSCSLAWCYVAAENGSVRGFVEKSALWGVYPHETID